MNTEDTNKSIISINGNSKNNTVAGRDILNIHNSKVTITSHIDGSSPGTDAPGSPGAKGKKNDMPHKKKTAAEFLNPFNDTIAIRDPARFIGRASEIRTLTTLLHGGSVALTGEPKIGKSSLLWHLARSGNSKIIGPINCLGLDPVKGMEDFYRFIADALDIEGIDWRPLRFALEKEAILLLIDELDLGPKYGITSDAMNHFRAVCESNPDFKMVAVSRTPLKEVFPDTGFGSPFYNLLQPLALEALSPADALLLLLHPWAPGALSFDAGACETLAAAAGYHPFKLQRAAFHYYESLLDPAYHWQSAYQQDIAAMM
ncbi:MAG: ATP-binding protein [bacterium]|nr:ATP-binding protein [bacterium]